MRRSQPKLSVIIPTFNRCGTIEKAVRSALTQSHEDLEVIVVDDQSTDGTERVVRSISDPRLHLLRTTHSSGGSPGFVRNQGIKLAKGKWLLFLDSDDFLPEKSVETLLNLFKSPDVGIAWGCKGLWRDGVRESVAFVMSQHPDGLVFEKFLLWTPGTGGLMVRREVFSQLKGFDSSMGAFEDLDFTLRFAIGRKWRVATTKEVTYGCVMDEGISTSLNSSYCLALDRFIQKHEELLRKFPTQYAHYLYKLSLAYFHAGEKAKAGEPLERLLVSSHATFRQRVVVTLYKWRLAFVVRHASRWLQKRDAKRRERIYRRKAS